MKVVILNCQLSNELHNIYSHIINLHLWFLRRRDFKFQPAVRKHNLNPSSHVEFQNKTLDLLLESI